MLEAAAAIAGHGVHPVHRIDHDSLFNFAASPARPATRYRSRAPLEVWPTPRAEGRGVEEG